MRRLSWTTLIVILVVVAGCSPSVEEGASEHDPQPEAPFEGAYAPALALTDLDGREWALSDLRGSAILLNFWATW